MYEDKEGGVVCGMLDAGRWCTSIPELLFGCDLGGAQQQLKHRFWLVAACTADRSCRQTDTDGQTQELVVTTVVRCEGSAKINLMQFTHISIRANILLKINCLYYEWCR